MRFKLLLEVEEGDGIRTFTSNSTEESQEELARSIAFDVATALSSTLNVTPDPFDIPHQVSPEDGLLRCLKAIHREWDGSQNFDRAVKVTVDLDKLREPTNDERDDQIVKNLEKMGVVVIRRESK